MAKNIDNTNACSYLLVSHGSRDRRPEIAMQQLAALVNHNQSKSVGIACLEVSPQPLHEQIKQFAKSCGEAQPLVLGHRLKIVPIFLLPGVHVMSDIPAEIALAQQALGEDVIIDLQPYLGSHPRLGSLFAKQMAVKNEAAWILLAHGSRRPGSEVPVAALAANLGAVVAFWAVPPSLESRVKELVAVGKQEIAILPYFLFAGGITDAIAQSVETLKLQFPGVTFYLAEPLGASTELAGLIWDLIDT
ncbi:sirohydrochlorin chelatase [Calothrix sp. PCC 7507]|uniref:sirohydrochlorin chelatase n=1 Tax=Calothrix sp. PCC 7507 TaxID=99598 RepID=UPI00029ED311|nr:sirohydrochlorin chelatase [Calothrix sp. PCC 7507]AFY34074.1 cobalamin (vitamin B12) biosynthesis CbiX protein [Calothrix sp. PCC 7507]